MLKKNPIVIGERANNNNFNSYICMYTAFKLGIIEPRSNWWEMNAPTTAPVHPCSIQNLETGTI